ncbi:MAG: dihydroorotase [Desulfobacterales bacterium]|nr:MAG: dihydroorotase [Desulfobacterales bacterium]
MEITLHSPLDMHLHVREDAILEQVINFSATPFSGAVIMPNLVSPVDTLEKVKAYRNEITRVCTKSFTPYMTLFFKNFTKQELVAAAPHIIGIKLFPAGITTQSENGVSNFDHITNTLALMEELGIPLLVHGESNGYVMDREAEFLPTYEKLARTFPDLHIVMEHITTAEAIALLDRYDNLSATITLHHMLLTLDDVIGGLMAPHLFCKPIAKTADDQEALCAAVFSGHKRIMFGSDSAPHLKQKKEGSSSAAGIFSAPVLLPLLTQIFERADKLDLLQGFISDNACSRYRLSPVNKQVTLRKEPFEVPESYGEITPFYNGMTIDWRISSIID